MFQFLISLILKQAIGRFFNAKLAKNIIELAEAVIKL